LGQDAALSFAVICRGQEIEVRGKKAGIRRQKADDRRQKKKGIFMWERLFRPELACPACPGRACPELLVLSLSKGSKGPGEPVEGSKGSRDWNDFNGF